jgi:hypothetical protein
MGLRDSTRRLRELLTKWRGYLDPTAAFYADQLAAVLDTNGDTKLEARMRCINCADMGATYWPDENFGPICERCNALIRPIADTEGDRPTPCVPGSHHPDCLCYRRPDPPVQP